jgi:hypothetical protein
MCVSAHGAGALRGTATEVPEKTKGRGTSNPPVLPRSSTVRPMTQPILGVGSRERIVAFAPAACCTLARYGS